jgi:peptidoglycan/LPS O-acetylase OafA/YrhL
MEKYKNLDGLRGLAALIVVFWHYSLGFAPSLSGGAAPRHVPLESLLSTTPLHIFIAGPSAVSLFFVLTFLSLFGREYTHYSSYKVLTQILLITSTCGPCDMN